MKTKNIFLLFFLCINLSLLYAESVYNLRARHIDKGIELRWSNPSNSVATTLRIERKQNLSSFSAITDIPSNLTCWTDLYVHPAENYTYRIVSFSNDKELGVSAVCDVEADIDEKYSLLRFFDNTLSLSAGTKISFVVSIPKKGKIKIVVLNSNLSVLFTLLNEEKEQGVFSGEWDGKINNVNVRPGVYILALFSPAGREMKKIVIRP